jgi:hypothetical protein
MRLLFFVLIAILCGACAEVTVERTRPNSQVTETPKPQHTPFTFPALSKADLELLDERFPRKFRDFLEQADQIELFETKVCLGGWMLPLNTNKFQGCEIVKQMKITNPSIRRQLLDGVFYAIGSEHNELACTAPIHGIRAIKGTDRLEMVICFHCHNFRGISTIGRFGGSFSPAPKELFDALLTEPEEK